VARNLGACKAGVVGGERCSVGSCRGGACYAPMGCIVQCADSGCEVVSGLQFGDSQVLTEQGSKSM